jgi:DNA replication protein DnaC
MLKLASLPFVKTIAEYDFTFNPELEKARIMSLFDLTFISRRENVFFLGPPGVGKLREDEQTGRNERARSYSRAGLVVVDEVGYTPIDRKECYLFFRFICRRDEKASLVITSNKAFTEWAELFEDPVLVTALLDRLLHHSVILSIKGQSWRLRGKSAATSRRTQAE